MTRYSKKDREDAALICQIMASTPDVGIMYSFVTESIGARRRSGIGLALDAWNEAARRSNGAYHSTPNFILEAECLLRTGWCPP